MKLEPMKLDIRKQLAQARSITADVIPVVVAAFMVFVVLLVLGPLTYGPAGIDFAEALLLGNGR